MGIPLMSESVTEGMFTILLVIYVSSLMLIVVTIVISDVDCFVFLI